MIERSKLIDIAKILGIPTITVDDEVFVYLDRNTPITIGMLKNLIQYYDDDQKVVYAENDVINMRYLSVEKVSESTDKVLLERIQSVLTYG